MSAATAAAPLAAHHRVGGIDAPRHSPGPPSPSKEVRKTCLHDLTARESVCGSYSGEIAVDGRVCGACILTKPWHVFLRPALLLVSDHNLVSCTFLAHLYVSRKARDLVIACTVAMHTGLVMQINVAR